MSDCSTSTSEHESMSRSLKRLQSIDSAFVPNEVGDRGCWIEDPSAWDYFCSLLTSLYGLFLIVFAIVMELSQKLVPDGWFIEMLFYSYMYGAGIFFLIYFYLFQIYPECFNALMRVAQRKKWINSLSSRHPLNHGEGNGSLYLRLGTLFFGTAGIVLFCLEIFVCVSKQYCAYKIFNWALASLFTFVQMHFIFCNSNIIITESKNVVKLGTIHLLSINIWTWLRFVIAKQEGKSVFVEHSSPSNSSTFDFGDYKLLKANSSALSMTTVSSFSYFGDFATLLTTCIVEYSVISAAIMFVLWRSIDEKMDSHQSNNSKRKHKVRIDCSASSAGLFAGVLFLICSLVSIGIYTIFSQHADDNGALLVFRLSDFMLFCFTLIGSSIGLYKMRILHYHKRKHSTNAEFLDEILLVIGLVGEMIHSSTGLMCWIATQSNFGKNKMETYMLVVFVVRELQVIIQAIFISLSGRLRAQNPKAVEEKPGKQIVTFLLIANVSLFFFHTLEGMKSVFGAALKNRRSKPYTTLICAVAPLVVFYRFHSSVCLAEIWKSCYNTKDRTPTSQFSNSSRSSIQLSNSEPNLF